MTKKKEVDFMESDGWTEISPKSDAQSWDRGVTVQGEFVGMAESSFENEDGTKATIASFLTTTGEVSYWTPAILKRRLSEIEPGDEVRVECLGKVRTRNGRNAWDFKVHVRR